MSLIDSVKELLRTEEVVVLACEDCGKTFEAPDKEAVETCEACGSNDVAMVTRKSV